MAMATATARIGRVRFTDPFTASFTLRCIDGFGALALKPKDSPY